MKKSPDLIAALIAGLITSLIAAPALAQPTADLAGIEHEVAAFAGARSDAVVPLDRRLRLAACARDHALGWFGTRRDMVEVRCPVPGGWRLFVTLSVGPEKGGSAALVAKGDAVTISIRDAGFALSQPGEALEAGGEGAWIRVRPVRPGAPVLRAPVLRAQVLRPGQVGIDLP